MCRVQPVVSGLAQGVDVSQWQGSIDWQGVASAKAFAYARATCGPSILDPRFDQNWRGIRAAGLLRGAYHYAVPGAQANDAQSQAGFFVRAIQKVGGLASLGDLPPVLDLEENPGKLSAQALLQWAETFCGSVDSLLSIGGPHRTMLYGSLDFLSFVHMGTALSQRPLWLSWPNPGVPPNLRAWNRWTLLQYSFRGTVRGITGAVDLDVFAMTAAALRSTFGGVSATPPQTPSPASQKIILWQHTQLEAPAEELAHQYGWTAANSMAALSGATEVVCVGGSPAWIAQAKAVCKGIWHEPLAGVDYWLTLQKVAAAGQTGRF